MPTTIHREKSAAELKAEQLRARMAELGMTTTLLPDHFTLKTEYRAPSPPGRDRVSEAIAKVRAMHFVHKSPRKPSTLSKPSVISVEIGAKPAESSTLAIDMQENSGSNNEMALSPRSPTGLPTKMPISPKSPTGSNKALSPKSPGADAMLPSSPVRAPLSPSSAHNVADADVTRVFQALLQPPPPPPPGPPSALKLPSAAGSFFASRAIGEPLPEQQKQPHHLRAFNSHSSEDTIPAPKGVMDEELEDISRIEVSPSTDDEEGDSIPMVRIGAFAISRLDESLNSKSGAPDEFKHTMYVSSSSDNSLDNPQNSAPKPTPVVDKKEPDNTTKPIIKKDIVDDIDAFYNNGSFEGSFEATEVEKVGNSNSGLVGEEYAKSVASQESKLSAVQPTKAASLKVKRANSAEWDPIEVARSKDSQTESVEEEADPIACMRSDFSNGTETESHPSAEVKEEADPITMARSVDDIEATGSSSAMSTQNTYTADLIEIKYAVSDNDPIENVRSYVIPLTEERKVAQLDSKAGWDFLDSNVKEAGADELDFKVEEAGADELDSKVEEVGADELDSKFEEAGTVDQLESKIKEAAVVQATEPIDDEVSPEDDLEILYDRSHREDVVVSVSKDSQMKTIASLSLLEKDSEDDADVIVPVFSDMESVHEDDHISNFLSRMEFYSKLANPKGAPIEAIMMLNRLMTDGNQEAAVNNNEKKVRNHVQSCSIKNKEIIANEHIIHIQSNESEEDDSTSTSLQNTPRVVRDDPVSVHEIRTLADEKEADFSSIYQGLKKGIEHHLKPAEGVGDREELDNNIDNDIEANEIATKRKTVASDDDNELKIAGNTEADDEAVLVTVDINKQFIVAIDSDSRCDISEDAASENNGDTKPAKGIDGNAMAAIAIVHVIDKNSEVAEHFDDDKQEKYHDDDVAAIGVKHEMDSKLENNQHFQMVTTIEVSTSSESESGWCPAAKEEGDPISRARSGELGDVTGSSGLDKLPHKDGPVQATSNYFSAGLSEIGHSGSDIDLIETTRSYAIDTGCDVADSLPPQSHDGEIETKECLVRKHESVTDESYNEPQHHGDDGEATSNHFSAGLRAIGHSRSDIDLIETTRSYAIDTGCDVAGVLPFEREEEIETKECLVSKHESVTDDCCNEAHKDNNVEATSNHLSAGLSEIGHSGSDIDLIETTRSYAIDTGCDVADSLPPQSHDGEIETKECLVRKHESVTDESYNEPQHHGDDGEATSNHFSAGLRANGHSRSDIDLIETTRSYAIDTGCDVAGVLPFEREEEIETKECLVSKHESVTDDCCNEAHKDNNVEATSNHLSAGLSEIGHSGSDIDLIETTRSYAIDTGGDVADSLPPQSHDGEIETKECLVRKHESVTDESCNEPEQQGDDGEATSNHFSAGLSEIGHSRSGIDLIETTRSYAIDTGCDAAGVLPFERDEEIETKQCLVSKHESVTDECCNEAHKDNNAEATSNSFSTGPREIEHSGSDIDVIETTRSYAIDTGGDFPDSLPVERDEEIETKQCLVNEHESVTDESCNESHQDDNVEATSNSCSPSLSEIRYSGSDIHVIETTRSYGIDTGGDVITLYLSPPRDGGEIETKECLVSKHELVTDESYNEAQQDDNVDATSNYFSAGLSEIGHLGSDIDLIETTRSYTIDTPSDFADSLPLERDEEIVTKQCPASKHESVNDESCTESHQEDTTSNFSAGLSEIRYSGSDIDLIETTRSYAIDTGGDVNHSLSPRRDDGEIETKECLVSEHESVTDESCNESHQEDDNVDAASNYLSAGLSEIRYSGSADIDLIETTRSYAIDTGGDVAASLPVGRDEEIETNQCLLSKHESVTDEWCNKSQQDDDGVEATSNYFSAGLREIRYSGSDIDLIETTRSYAVDKFDPIETTRSNAIDTFDPIENTRSYAIDTDVADSLPLEREEEITSRGFMSGKGDSDAGASDEVPQDDANVTATSKSFSNGLSEITYAGGDVDLIETTRSYAIDTFDPIETTRSYAIDTNVADSLPLLNMDEEIKIPKCDDEAENVGDYIEVSKSMEKHFEGVTDEIDIDGSEDSPDDEAENVDGIKFEAATVVADEVQGAQAPCGEHTDADKKDTAGVTVVAEETHVKCVLANSIDIACDVEKASGDDYNTETLDAVEMFRMQECNVAATNENHVTPDTFDTPWNAQKGLDAVEMFRSKEYSLEADIFAVTADNIDITRDFDKASGDDKTEKIDAVEMFRIKEIKVTPEKDIGTVSTVTTCDDDKAAGVDVTDTADNLDITLDFDKTPGDDNTEKIDAVEMLRMKEIKVISEKDAGTVGSVTTCDVDKASGVDVTEKPNKTELFVRKEKSDDAAIIANDAEVRRSSTSKAEQKPSFKNAAASKSKNISPKVKKSRFSNNDVFKIDLPAHLAGTTKPLEPSSVFIPIVHPIAKLPPPRRRRRRGRSKPDVMDSIPEPIDEEEECDDETTEVEVIFTGRSIVDATHKEGEEETSDVEVIIGDSNANTEKNDNATEFEVVTSDCRVDTTHRLKKDEAQEEFEVVIAPGASNRFENEEEENEEAEVEEGTTNKAEIPTGCDVDATQSSEEPEEGVSTEMKAVVHEDSDTEVESDKAPQEEDAPDTQLSSKNKEELNLEDRLLLLKLAARPSSSDDAARFGLVKPFGNKDEEAPLFVNNPFSSAPSHNSDDDELDDDEGALLIAFLRGSISVGGDDSADKDDVLVHR